MIDWTPRVGQMVYVLSSHRYNGSRLQGPFEIVKVGKAQGSLSDGRRFYLDRLDLVGTRSDAWGPIARVIAPNDPALPRLRGGERLARAKSALISTFNDWKSGKAEIREVIAAAQFVADAEPRADA